MRTVYGDGEMTEWYKRNRTRLIAKQREYYHKHKEQAHEYYEKNKEYYRVYNKKYYQKNKWYWQDRYLDYIEGK